MQVLLTNTSLGTTSTLVLNTDYTVSLNANQNASPGGSVTMIVAPASNYALTLTSSIANTQPSDLTNAGNFYPQTVNDSLDRATIQIQQLQTSVNSALRIPVSAPTGTSTVLPFPVKNTLLGWDASGQTLINYTPTTAIPANATVTLLTIAALNVATAAIDQVVNVAGYTNGVLGGGSFRGVSQGALVIDNLNIFASGTAGVLWLRIGYTLITPQNGGADTTGLVDSTAQINLLKNYANFGIAYKQIYQYGQLSPALGAFGAYDNATIGSNEKLLNSGFTGSAASWTLTNFTYSANTITHAAATIGEASQSITLKPYVNYQLTVVLTTTTGGTVDFQIGGVTLLDDTGYYTFDPGTGTYVFNYLNQGATTAVFRALTDINWAGSIDSISLIEVATDFPYAYYSCPTDDQTFRNPQGLKFGRYNAGNIAIGDKQTLAMAGNAVSWTVAVGPRALSSVVSSFENTAVGAFAGKYTNTDRNCFFGYSAGKYNTIGYALTCLGYKAGVLNTTGVRNTSVGFHAQFQNTAGNDNFAAGFQALYSARNNNNNTSIGSQSAQNCVGNSNVFLGALAGYLNNNVAITYSYAFGTTLGSESKIYGNSGVVVGYNASIGVDGTPQDNAISVGANTSNKVANTTKIGNSQNVCTLSGILRAKQVFNANTTAGAATYTAAQFASSVIERSGPGGNFSDTTPTAAALVALVGGAEPGTSYDLLIRNLTAFTLTMLAGSGITLGGTTTCAGGRARLYKIQFGNVTSGAETATVYGACIQDN
jgi:hypothetical protein